MLKQLAVTIMLSTGVTTVTPVCNAPEEIAETVETTYHLTPQQTGQSSGLYTGQIVSNFPNTDTEGQDNEVVTNYQASNLALNVIATKYETHCVTSSTPIRYYVENYNYFNANNYLLYEHASRITFVIQIDTYNYNKNTEVETTLYTSIEPYTYLSQGTIRMDNFYFARTTYTCNETSNVREEQNWRQYLQRQNRSFNANEILVDIEDPNSNYYYNKRQQVIEMTSTSYTDEVQLTLVPNTTNFIVIDYVPLIKASASEGGSQYEEIDSTRDTIYFDYDNKPFDVGLYEFSGVNIIPEGSIEVVDIPGLMWQILEMPFAFVSQAFNLTLFPGTPYQVNISNLFLSIIAIFVFVWLIGLFMKMKG